MHEIVMAVAHEPFRFASDEGDHLLPSFEQLSHCDRSRIAQPRLMECNHGSEWNGPNALAETVGEILDATRTFEEHMEVEQGPAITRYVFARKEEKECFFIS